MKKNVFAAVGIRTTANNTIPTPLTVPLLEYTNHGKKIRKNVFVVVGICTTANTVIIATPLAFLLSSFSLHGQVEAVPILANV
jgi:hypothetical protein